MLFGTLQTRFNKHWPVNIFVAVSDGGRITREIEVPELLKADQLPEAIREMITRHRRGRWSPNPLNNDGERTLAKDELGRLVEFLRLSHTPQGHTSQSHAPLNGEPNGQGRPQPDGPKPAPRQAATLVTRDPAATVMAGGMRPRSPESPAVPAPVLPVSSDAPPTCRKCGSADLVMVYARTSRPYYFRCRACESSTPTLWTCAGCGEPARVRKRGPDFFRVCEEGCGQVVHVFRNADREGSSDVEQR
jgi:hypothetical protein